MEIQQLRLNLRGITKFPCSGVNVLRSVIYWMKMAKLCVIYIWKGSDEVLETIGLWTELGLEVDSEPHSQVISNGLDCRSPELRK